MKSTEFQWYHEIDLGNGEITQPVNYFGDTWGVIKECLKQIDYRGKRVLDLASFDGKWAFEAEQAGAFFVVASDVSSRLNGTESEKHAFDKFLYARECLKSKIVPYYDRSIHSITEILPLTGPFEIIHNMGLLYHLENPWHGLKQCRKMLVDGGIMMLETAFDSESKDLSMLMNRGDSMFYKTDRTTYWAPSLTCLEAMLIDCAFSVKLNTASISTNHDRVKRVCLLATASPFSGTFGNDYQTSI